MAYLYSSVLTDICTQLADPDKTTYEERAKDHFLRAISYFITAGEFNEGDIFGYEKVDKTQVFVENECDIKDLDVLYIKNITPPLTNLLVSGSRYNIQLVDYEKAQNIISNPENHPSDEDVYVFRSGSKLYSIKSATSNFTGGTGTFWLFYVKDVAGGWNDSDDLTDEMRESFIRKCITMSVKTLKEEDIITQ